MKNIPIFQRRGNFIENVIRINVDAEKRGKENTAVYLPERLLSKRIYESKEYNMEILLALFPVYWVINWNAIKRALISLDEDATKLGFLYRNMF